MFAVSSLSFISLFIYSVLLFMLPLLRVLTSWLLPLLLVLTSWLVTIQNIVMHSFCQQSFLELRFCNCGERRHWWVINFLCQRTLPFPPFPLCPLTHKTRLFGNWPSMDHQSTTDFQIKHLVNVSLYYLSLAAMCGSYTALPDLPIWSTVDSKHIFSSSLSDCF